MKFTNTQRGPRGINTTLGSVLVGPGQSVEVDVYQREQQHIEAAGWFEVEGDYSPDPENSVAGASTSAVDDLRRQLAERDAELAALRSGSLDRDALKAEADQLGLDYARNISTEKLKELIDAKKAG